jgi:hypothetical protein
MPDLEWFASTFQLASKSEVDRAVLFGFFSYKEEGKAQFSIRDICSWFDRLHFSQPNLSRLRKNLAASRSVVRGLTTDTYKIGHSKLLELEKTVIWETGNEKIPHVGSIIPESIYSDTRGYLVSLCEQINSAYEHNIFDGCAVLMRRLMEILLISSFENMGVADDIRQADGAYMMLEKIIDRAKSSTKLQLSRNSRETIEEFRRLGNFSAHKIYYNCKRDDIKKVALDFRALVEELFYKAGIRV